MLGAPPGRGKDYVKCKMLSKGQSYNLFKEIVNYGSKIFITCPLSPVLRGFLVSHYYLLNLIVQQKI